MSWANTFKVVRQAVAQAAGIADGQVVWGWQNVDAPGLAYVALRLGGSRTVGIDYERQTTDLGRPAGQEIVSTARGLREVPLDVECFTGDTAPTGNEALALAETLRTGLGMGAIRDLMQTVSFAIFDPGRLQYIPDVVSQGFRGRAILNARCYMPAAALVAYYGYIASVSGTATTKMPDGAEVVVPYAAAVPVDDQ